MPNDFCPRYFFALNLVAGLLSLILAKGVFACSCIEYSALETYSKAKAIFVAQITETQHITRFIAPDLIRGKFDVREILKGYPERIPFVETHAPVELGCTLLQLKPAVTYLFVVYENNSISQCTSVMVGHFPAQEWLVEFRKLRDSVK